ncbi:hydin-like protein [Trypanosoma conorhini]|uniref:Hydin-like protein n=1 Tax=Trypanosoma conorhini TaxID=83891 RepID=A0A3R7NFE1_9TRYP|nr:hydin-like protein [Trypanosoma conorhini]RNF21339.1 hydin-like protein [Trypanosoma conorhini]
MYHSQGAASGAGGGGGEAPTAVAAYSRFPKILTFEVNPQEIMFRDFEPHKTYESPLHLKNTTKETQFVRVGQPQSRVLALRPPRRNVTSMKVAPGLSVTYKVLFTPEENRNYSCDLVVTTEEEEFTVAVHAIASRGKLTLPASFTVALCPVKSTGTTSLFLRNTGKLECQWRAEASSPFAVTPSSGLVPPDGGVFPVSVEFAPMKLQQYESTIHFLLGPEEDMVQELPVIGTAVEVEVVLEQSQLEFPGTFVTLESQALVRVRNDSGYTVNFSWKSDRSDAEEWRAVERNLLGQTEAVSHAVLASSPNEATRKRLREERVKTLAKGGRVFDDDVFTLEPASGTIYAKGSKEFVVTFNPQLAMEYLATAYLDIGGRRQRIPLQVKGTGLGPQCVLEYTRLDIGEIFVGALHEYQVAIMNKGCIEARYVVLPQDTLMGRKFVFQPVEGVLAPGTEGTLFIQLQSDLVGLISETFRIHLHGSLEDLTLRIRGSVTGPALQFDMDELDFGNVSYNWLHSRILKMLNIGQIPINFRLRIPESCPLHGVVTVSPSEGTLPPKQQQEIRVSLTSNIVGNCETVLLVDVEGVGDGVDSIPIKAACLVPTLQLSTEKLHYGTCFVGHEYIMNLEVVNKTALLGKYEVILLNEEGVRAANALVVIDSPERSHTAKVIEPRSRSLVPIKLTPLAVGGLHVTLYVRVLGSDEPPLPLLLTATARGPTVTVEPKSLAFGTLMLLERSEREFVLNNTSPIPALFSAKFIQTAGRNARLVFSVDQSRGKIDPYSRTTVKVSACLDDARSFSEKIQVIVRHAEDDALVIPVTAYGKGYALVPTTPVDKIDFGDVFTETMAEKEICLRNDGQRAIEVLWSGSRGTRVVVGGPPIVYRILPETAVIGAGSCCTFTVQGLADAAGVVTEEFVLKDKKEFKPILVTSVTGNFVLPVIAYSTKRVVFDYVYGAEGELGNAVMMRTFTMKNTTTQSLNVTLRRVEAPAGSHSPFTLISPTSFTLLRGETHIVAVNCDAHYRHDYVAHTAKGRILVAFTNHPFTEYVGLVGNIAFPTIGIEPECRQVNFGSILTDTEGRSELTLTNLSSLVAAEFVWSIEYHNEVPSVQSETMQKRFDFVPFRGVIPPGGKRVVEAVFYGTRGRHEATATCMLKGGPSYDVSLIGWSDAAVRFDCTSLDFGVMHYSERQKKTISISSPSRVAVPFTVDTATLKQPGSLVVKPQSGTVTNKVVLSVSFCPMIPDEVVETFSVQVGHLDPQLITVRGMGQAHTILVSSPDKGLMLTRVEDPQYARCLEELKEKEWVPYLERSGFPQALPDVAPLVLEAERQAYCRNLVLAATTPTTPTALFPPAARAKDVDAEASRIDEQTLLARYAIDFGHMTRLEVRTVKLSLTNTSIYPVGVVLDRHVVEPGPLHMEPRKIPTMAPFSKVEVVLSLTPSDTEKVANGANQFEFLLNINKGPRVAVEVRCFVATPALTPCETVLDFGDVLLGRVKKIPLHFYNAEAIPCTWRMTLIESKRRTGTDSDTEAAATAFSNPSSLAPRRQFKVNKERGTLPPQTCMSVMVSFMSFVRGPAKARLRLRYASNPDEQYVVFKGNVVCVNVELSPSPLVFPPMLPWQTMKNSFIITNNEERPVEVFNMNLDERHRVCVGVLQRALEMQKPLARGECELHLPIREPGEYLPQSLLEFVFTDVQREELTLEYKDADALDGDTAREGLASSHAFPKRSRHSQLRMEAPASLSRPLDGSPSETSESLTLSRGKPQLVIVTGPPFSGKTTQIRQLLQTADMLQIDLDAMVRAEAEFDTAEGELIRTILTEREENRAARAGGDAVNDYTPLPVEKLLSSNEVKILYALLLRHLSTVKYAMVVVIDDVKSILTVDREAVLLAIGSAATATGRTLQIISLGVSEATAGFRRSLEVQEKCRETVEAAVTAPLTEQEYEQLGAEEREVYNRRLLHFNACKRALAEASSEVSRYAAELERSPQPTVQEDVDAQLAAKEEQESPARVGSKGKKSVPQPHPRPRWAQLSELDQYKELYTQLRRAEGGAVHVVLNGEEAEKHVNSSIVRQILSPNYALPQTPTTPQPSEEAGSHQVSMGFLPNDRSSGVWELITEETLGSKNSQCDQFRFFTPVQREAVVKKAAKGAPLQTMLAMEEATRWVVPPKSSVEVTVVFCSDKLGQLNFPFTFGVTGTSQEINLPVVACTAYPEICRDDKKIFSVTKSRLVAGRQPSRVFVTSKRTYDFGPLIVPGGTIGAQGPTTRKGRRMSELGNSITKIGIPSGKDNVAQDTMTFTNTGIFPADVSLLFGKEKESTFSVTPNKFTLPVGETASVVLRAVPETIGEVSSTLVVTVRDNPTPWFVNVSCIGTRPAVTLDGKKDLLVQYGRCLITRQEEKVITIANDSLMPIRWRIAGVDNLPMEFALNSTSGLLDVNGIYPLEVVFKPTRPGVHNVALKVEVTDAEETLFESLPLTIKAEAHDVVVEWSRRVDFKLMHVGETRKETVLILNKSAYEVGYLLRLPKPLQGLITLNPSEGIMRGLVGFKDASLATVEVTIRFDREGEIPASLGVIEASFFDPLANELLFPVQSIPVSGEAWYNRFSIKPSCIDFGSCVANQSKQCSFELRNTGRFPLNFRLFNYKNGPALPQQDDEEGVEKKHRKAAKSDAVFQLGAFTVSPSTGSVAVGDSFLFQVVTVQGTGSSHKETLGIYVDHCDPETEAKGIPFELVASITTPGIVADLSSLVDVETIFEEQQVVTSHSQRNKASRVYSRDSRTFYFGSTLVGSRVEERFRIANCSPLTCTVKLQLLPPNPRDGKEREKKETEPLLYLDGFQLLVDGEPEKTNRLQLPSFESRFVTVSFSPPTLQSFQARFEAVVIGGTDPKTSALVFDLAGEGVLPTVEYILPPRLQIPFNISLPSPVKKIGKGKGKDLRKVTVQHMLNTATDNIFADTIQLPLTLIGSVTSRTFTVRNSGEVDAHIRLSTPDMFPNDIVVSNLRRDIFLPVGGAESFTLSFTPTSIEKHRVRLRVSVTENPYEDRELWVEAESYFSPLSFENIDPGSEDQLTLGHCYVSQPVERTVVLCNNSPHAIRFEWGCPSSILQCSPRVGHISPGSSKQLTLRLYTDTVSGETISCVFRVTSIEVQGGEDWDDAQSKARWVVAHSEGAEPGRVSISSDNETRKNLRRVFETVPEPLYNVTNDIGIQKPLYVSYACEFASYKVTLPMNNDVEISDTLTFPSTKIFQRRTTVLRVQNTGPNVLPFAFEVNDPARRSGTEPDITSIFTVEPASGRVEPHTYQDVRVTFAPRTIEDVSQALIGSFPHSLQPKFFVSLQGTAECPLVHFNVPPCDYLDSRVDGEAGPELNPDTIPIMFRSCGLQSKSTVCFKVINPSTTTYRFEWISDPLSQRISPFRCLTPSGSISAGKQYEMTFDYTSSSIGLREAKWTFFISGHISVPFLLVGKTEEPNVFLHVTRVNFGGVTVGTKDERIIELENREDISFPFSFDRSVLSNDNNAVGVKPLGGTLPPRSTIPLTISFTPKDEISVNTRLLCRVKRMSDPLTINVKGEGLRIHSSLAIEDEDADDTAEPVIVPPSQVFHLNLGRVQVENVVQKRFVLTNEGQCPMDYVMAVPEQRFIKVDPLSGTVAPKQRAVIMLVYSPTEEETLRNFKIQCRVARTITYSIRLAVVSYVPKVQFGFMKHDFGPCFITEFSSDATVSKSLTMLNMEAKESVALDCLLSHGDIFDLDGNSFVLSPGEARNLNISFAPFEVGDFKSELRITLNGSYSFFIPLKGEGVIPRIDVPVRSLKLGVARIGERRVAELRLDCRSRAITPVSLVNCVDADLQQKGISIVPAELFLMRPRETRTITVSFRPSARMPEFQRELRMIVCGREMPLAIISASCEDAEVHLDIQNILFDDVVVGATASRRIVIMNSGDFAQRFKWDPTLLPQGEMRVLPSAGSVHAHSEQVCEFVYIPKKPGSVFRRAVSVEFDDAPALSVNVEAHAVERPKVEAVLSFECCARDTVAKTVTVENPTDAAWTVKPLIEGRLWTAPKTLQINPRSTAVLSVTYAPLFVTKEKDIATLFIPLPNGSARNIQLEGVASHPVEEAIVKEKIIEANTPHLETFEIHNGTSQPLRFHVSVQWSPEPEKGMVTVKAPVSIDVPAKQTKSCPITFSSLKEGSLRGTAQFRCIEREDYTQVFDVALLVVPKTVSSKSQLVAAVRSAATYIMSITNPLEKNVTVSTRVENGSDVVFVDPSITIPRKSTADIPIRFFPLLHKEYPAATVTATSAELGTVSCKLHLRSNPPGPEKVTRVTCPLGQTVVFPLRFKHYC